MTHERELFFTDVGKGEVALVFLHYFGGSSNTWQKMITELSPQFRCIAIDLPGFGDSQNELSNLSVSSCADAVVQVLTLLGLKQYVCVGHSMGGKIALQLASFQPAGLISLVLVAPSPPTPEPMDPNAKSNLLNAYGDEPALEKIVHTITAVPLTKQEIEDLVADNLRVSPVSWNWWVELGSQEDISPQMPAIRIPVLVISGEHDPNFSTAFLHNALIRFFPGATFVEIPKAGHLLPVETPVDTAKLIREFAGS